MIVNNKKKVNLACGFPAFLMCKKTDDEVEKKKAQQIYNL